MQDFLNMIYIFGCGALGKTPDINRCVNISKVRDWALKQECWDVVYCALRPLIESGEVKIPPEIAGQLEKIFTANVAKNIQKIEFNKRIADNLKNMGIECCQLKGTVLARLYHTPEVRISSDTDILIKRSDRKKVTDYLTSQGFDVEKYEKKDHHIKARHPVGGLLEVHVAFHSHQTKDVVFAGKAEYKEPYIELPDGVVTLSINDNLLFITCHLIKHLINDCVGIRQIMDLSLYMKKYEKEIDWEKYNSFLKELSYYEFIRVVKGIAVKYFGFEFNDAELEEEKMYCVFDDMKRGGIFSLEEKNRNHFYSKFTEIKSNRGKSSFLLYKYINSEAGIINLIFPSVEYTSAHCAYVAKYPYLLPIAWVHRAVRIMLGKKPKTVKQEEINETEKMIERRMEMVRKLGMLGKE